jgi:PAS domain S-box-containing protein
MNMRNGTPKEISAAEAVRNFGLWQSEAMSQPIMITHHGKPRLALLSFENYNQLRSAADVKPAATAGSGLHPGVLNHLPQAFVAVDADMTIVAVNNALEEMMDMMSAELVGQPWQDKAVNVSALFTQHLMRTVRTGEASEFEFSTDRRAGVYCTAHTFPYRDGAAALIDNCTELRELRLQEDNWRALQCALGQTKTFSTVQLNLRGVISRAGDDFHDMTGFRPVDLQAARLADIMAPADRRAVGAAVEQVLADGTTTQLQARLLTRDLTEAPCTITLSAISHKGVTDGAVAVISGLTPKARDEKQDRAG